MVMSRRLPGPDRKKLLEARIRCIRKAERRITTGAKLECAVRANVPAYALSLAALKYKRSEYTAELLGLPWEAKRFNPRLPLSVWER